MPAKVLLLGASGQLGRQIVAAAAAGRSVEIVPAWRTCPDSERRFSLEDPASISAIVDRFRPNHVILTAAATNVDWCENNRRDAEILNTLAPLEAALSARRIGASMTFISTDYVFDGIDGPYPETATTRPLNVYGATKLAAEQAVLGAASDNLIIRTCQIFGFDPRRANFVVRLVDQLRDGRRVTARGDLFGTPTYAPDLATRIIELTVRGSANVWHLAGETFLSRFAFGRRIARAFALPEDAVVETSGDATSSVTRPLRAGLKTVKPAPSDLGGWTSLDDSLAELAHLEVVA